jgi:hypothetical protein
VIWSVLVGLDVPIPKKPLVWSQCEFVADAATPDDERYIRSPAAPEGAGPAGPGGPEGPLTAKIVEPEFVVFFIV